MNSDKVNYMILVSIGEDYYIDVIQDDSDCLYQILYPIGIPFYISRLLGYVLHRIF